MESSPPMTPTKSPPRPLRLIYAGLARAGTHSLKLALLRLNPKLNIVHGEDVCKGILGSHAEMSNALIEGNVERALVITAEMGYDVTLEAHGHYWREIVSLEKEKDVGVIFIPRDFESWYDSWAWILTASSPMFRYPLRALPFCNALKEFTIGLSSHSFQLSVMEAERFVMDPYSLQSRNVCRAAHNRLMRDMEEFVRQNPDRCLVLNKTEGYDPLCRFLDLRGLLDVECPPAEEPFPRVFSRNVTNVMCAVLLLTEAILYAIPLLVCSLLFFFFAKRRRCQLGTTRDGNLGDSKHQKQN